MGSRRRPLSEFAGAVTRTRTSTPTAPIKHHRASPAAWPIRWRHDQPSSDGRRLTAHLEHYRRRVIAAALGFLAGAGLLLAGVVVNVIPIAVTGFLVMLACSMWAVTSYRRMTGSTTARAPTTGRGPGKKRGGTRCRRASKQAESRLMARLEERWRRRQQGGP